GTPAPKNAATGNGLMLAQTKNSPSLPFKPWTVCGARARNFLSIRSDQIEGGSTKCESAEMTVWLAIGQLSFCSLPIGESTLGIPPRRASLQSSLGCGPITIDHGREQAT